MQLPFSLDIQILIRSLILVIFIFVLIQIVQRIRKILYRRWVEHEMDAARKGRFATSISVGVTTLDGIFVIGGFISLLNILGIDMTPILASLGIVGLALSLGAQALIKDLLAGLTILTEHQFSVGDEIKVGSVRGEVEEISMRATRVREYNGMLHIFPNSEVRIVANASHEWMRAIVDINLPYSVDLYKTQEILKSATDRCAKDEQIKPLLLESPEVIGWNALSDWAVQIRLAARTLPGKQYIVQATLRRDAIDALNQAGIPIALPTLSVKDSGNSPS